MNMPVVHFDMITPLNGEIIAGHIQHSTSLGLPEADDKPIRSLTVIANGPSAITAPQDGETLALNGALKLFTDNGIAPSFWAACDPQDCVADFIPDNPPKETIYLVASKCHPRVFERLQGCDVRLWHINDHDIPEGLQAVHVASSITLCAMPLMRRAFGYRAFDVYGWDGCYQETDEGLIKHHASDPAIETIPDMLELIVGATQVGETFEGGRTFKTTRTWAAEAQDAMILLTYADYKVTIHGDGLIKAIYATR